MSTYNVLVTGSSNGFGFLIAQTLLENGHTVLATMRQLTGRNAARAEALQAAAAGKTGTLRLLELDVTDDASVGKAVAQALEWEGHIDVVVNNAGFGAVGFAEGMTVAQLHTIFDVNVYGVQRLNRAVLPSMRARQSGLLLHISSVMGRVVVPFAAPYTATKFALEGLAESYRYELANSGVEVAIVEPGGFGTGFLDNMAAPADQARVDSYGALKDAPEQLWHGFGQMLSAADAPDPQLVADAVVTLIESPTGTRPLRVVVDPLLGGEGPEAINQTADVVQSQLLASIGMGEAAAVGAAD